MANQNDKLSQLRRRDFLRLLFKSALVFTVMLSISLLTSCGGGGGGNNAGQTTVPTVGQSGGTFTSSDASASLTFPAGVLGHDVSAIIIPTASPVNSDQLDTGSAPAYSVQFSQTIASTNAPDPSGTSTVVFQSKLPSGIDVSRTVVYISRPDFSTPIVVSSTLDPKTGQVVANIPVAAFYNSVETAKIRPHNFIILAEIIIGIGIYHRETLDTSAVIQPAAYDSPSHSWRQNRWPASSDVAGKRIAIVVPGTWRDLGSDGFPALGEYLNNLGYYNASDNNHFFYRVLGVNYNTLASPDQTGDLLAAQIAQLTSDGARVFVFAHSQGGLVSRWAIEQDKNQTKNVVMLTMFGTPNEGIPAIAIETVALGVHMSPFAPSMSAMSNEPNGNVSQFLHRLNDTPTKGSAAYYTVSGDIGWFEADNDTNKWEKSSHLLLVDGPDDGVVYVSSATGQHINLANHCTSYDPNHNSLVLHVVHSNLPDVKDNHGVSDEESTLGPWIREQEFGTTTVNVQ